MERFWRVPLGGVPEIVGASVGVHLPESQRERTYRFAGFWTFHIYQHGGEIRVGEERFEIGPGWASMIAPGVEHHYTFVGRAEHAYVFLKFPEGGEEERRRVPVTQDLGGRFLGMDRGLREAIAWAATEPRRAQARVWDLLWQLVNEGGEGGERGELAAGSHPAVRRACEWLEVNLQSAVTLAELARHAGVSGAHLTRLFTKEMGVGAFDYLRRRRALRAGVLLRHSSLSIKEIAGEVGLGDLHLFNKTVRRELGVSPREYRRMEPGLEITYRVVGGGDAERVGDRE
jgi:AraC-like DNA-binding protein